MKRLALLILAFVGMHVEARPITEDEKSAVENVIREEMKDPDAAKFYHMDFPYPDTTFTYCGYVNGKNSYGAYAGKQLFATFLGKMQMVNLLRHHLMLTLKLVSLLTKQ